MRAPQTIKAPQTIVENPRRAWRRGPGSSRPSDTAGRPTYLILGTTALAVLAPFYYMLVAASRPMSEMNVWPPGGVRGS